MKIARVIYKNKERWGSINADVITFLKKSPYSKIEPTKQKVPLKFCKLLPPVIPTKIICVGLNYKDHARELNMDIPKQPIIFLKPVSSLIGQEDIIKYPKQVNRLDYEAELAVVIKKTAKNIKVAQVEKYIFGYICLNDVTARDVQKIDGQWTRAKSFDTFCPVGPWVETNLNPQCLMVRSYLNGKVRQESTTKNFIFPIDYIVAFISSVMTLLPGDIIATGTPFGVGPMARGDKIEIEIEGVGRLVNYVR